MTTRRSSPVSSARRGSRRGMTFLEVVIATAMLGLVASAAFGVFNFITSAQWREQRRLGATEVANRLIMQYLDNPTGMPDPSRTVDYGPEEAMSKYRWEYSEDPVVLVEAAPENRDQTRSSPLPPDRFKQVSVRVWLSEYSGGTRFPEPSTPSAILTRMVDPVMPRNPDSYMRMLNDPRGFEEIMRQLMGISAGAGRGGSATTRNGGLQGDGTRATRGRSAISPSNAFGQGRQRAGTQTGGRLGGQGGRTGGGATR